MLIAATERNGRKLLVIGLQEENTTRASSRSSEVGPVAEQRSLEDRLLGAKIVHVQAIAEPFRWVLVFEHRGTDDDSGYTVVDISDVHFADGGDPEAWRELLSA